MGVAFARNLEGKARAGKVRQSECEVTDIALVMCLDVALPAIRRLDLALNDKIGPVWPVRISAVLARLFGLERDLVIVTGFASGDIVCVKSHEAGCALRQASMQGQPSFTASCADLLHGRNGPASTVVVIRIDPLVNRPNPSWWIRGPRLALRDHAAPAT